MVVWAEAASAVAVSVPRTVRNQLSLPVEREFPAPDWRKALLRAARPHQWVKNLLVFVPVITANALSDIGALWSAFAAFICFSLIASGVYLINDLLDLDADRKHPAKHKRIPFTKLHGWSSETLDYRVRPERIRSGE